MYCPKCGTEHVKCVAFCKKCGYAFSVYSKKTTKKQNIWKQVLAFIMALVVLLMGTGIGIGAVFIRRDPIWKMVYTTHRLLKTERVAFQADFMEAIQVDLPENIPFFSGKSLDETYDYTAEGTIEWNTAEETLLLRVSIQKLEATHAADKMDESYFPALPEIESTEPSTENDIVRTIEDAEVMDLGMILAQQTEKTEAFIITENHIEQNNTENLQLVFVLQGNTYQLAQKKYNADWELVQSGKSERAEAFWNLKQSQKQKNQMHVLLAADVSKQVASFTQIYNFKRNIASYSNLNLEKDGTITGTIAVAELLDQILGGNTDWINAILDNPTCNEFVVHQLQDLSDLSEQECEMYWESTDNFYPSQIMIDHTFSLDLLQFLKKKSEGTVGEDILSFLDKNSSIDAICHSQLTITLDEFGTANVKTDDIDHVITWKD